MATSTFLAEVLNKSATLGEFREALTVVNEKINHLKNELLLSLGSSFGTYDSDIHRVSSWFVEIRGVDEDTAKLDEELKDERLALSLSSEELSFVQDELLTCNNNIHLLKSLVDVVQNLESADPTEIITASKRLSKARDGLKIIIQEFFELRQVEWVKGLHSAIGSQIDQTYELALNAWDAKFHFEHNTLVIDPDIGKGDVPNLVDSLRKLNYFTKHFDLFCAQFWQELLSKGCTPDYCVKITYPNLKNSKKGLLIAQKDVPVRDTDPDSPADSIPVNANFGSTNAVLIHVKKLNTPIAEASVVFKNISRLLCQMSDIFGTKIDVMSDMAEILGPKMVNQLSAKCLKFLILQTSNGLREKARENILHLHEFREKLNEINFRLSVENEAVFDEFETNFDRLFMRQVREDILAQVRSLILSDLHHTCETDPAESSFYAESNSSEGLVVSPQKSPYVQQSYTISRSIAELVVLLQEHLERYPHDLLLISNVFNMFLGIINIPKHEADAKEFIPLSAVLIHNNCMYLAYHAEFTFSKCEDKIPLLRSKANQAFSYMMKTIRTHLNGMIAQAMTGLDDESDTAKDKRELQFLAIGFEFQKLNKIFKAVLPSRPWREALAALIDHTLNEICGKVLTCEDISASKANELADSFTKLAIETSTVFKKDDLSPREIEAIATKLVAKWERFRLLTFILTASMRDIGDKWVNGCGPLSMAFTAEEIRKLVRALFQNTDHRATFLNSIK